MADQAVKRGLHLDRIQTTTTNANAFRVQTRMKITRHYNEQAYHDASQQTTNHRRLHQADSSSRKLMSMPRKVQRSMGVSVNTRLGADHHQLIMPSISKDCSNTFLERSFIYAAPCDWNKLSECIRTSNFDSFRKSVKTMLFAQQYGC